MKYLMNQHSCLLCLGSNYNRQTCMESARKALTLHFPTIRFSKEIETIAIGDKFFSPFSNQLARFDTCMEITEVRKILKDIEHDNGRCNEDKTQGIVKLDIDLLVYDELILKPMDLEREFVKNLKETEFSSTNKANKSV